jgi:hypothetical protein
MMDEEPSAQRQRCVEIGVGCQLETFPTQFEQGPPSREELWSSYLHRRARHLVRRIARFLSQLTRAYGATQATTALGLPVPPTPPRLRPGDVVRVRSAGFIRSTLDEHGKHCGCGFGLGMYQYCGRELRVAKVVNRFFDEGRWRMLQTRNMVLLEGVHCDGANSPDTRGCDRMCFYFWRTEWLEKIDDSPFRTASTLPSN